jgi:molybdopterin-guanine dinucleotide biosynthesis protein
MDIVLTEGFKRSRLPKIEIHRAALAAPLLGRGEFDDPNLLAVVSDELLEIDIPCFDLEDVLRIADFLESSFLASN